MWRDHHYERTMNALSAHLCAHDLCGHDLCGQLLQSSVKSLCSRELKRGAHQ